MMSVIEVKQKLAHLCESGHASASGQCEAGSGWWKALRCAALAMACCLVLTISANAQMEINVSTRVTGNKVRGPKKIRLTHVNRLRYNVGVNQAVTYTAGLSLSEIGGFIPKSPAAAARTTDRSVAPPPGGAAAAGCPNPVPSFLNLANVLDRHERTWEALQRRLNQDIDVVNGARELTEQFIRRTDGILTQPNGPATVIAGIGTLMPTINDALGLQYGVNPTSGQDLNSLLADLEQLRTDIIRLQAQCTDWAAANAALLSGVEDRIAGIKSAVNAVNRNSEQGKKFLEHQAWLRNWRARMEAVRSETAFQHDVSEISCSFAFSGMKETKIELLMLDQLDRTTQETPREVVTVVCSAPISLSGGFGFSRIDEQEFTFVQSLKTDAMGRPTQEVVNRFGLKNSSSFRTLPLLLINTRVWEPHDIFALHASAGAGVDVKTGQAGTDIEYVVGPSFSFWRSIFVTPGLHVGRVPSLAGGFQLGQEVPTGVSQPPITKKWEKGFAVTFTYFIR